MAEKRSKEFRVRVRGELACFTRPEMKVERVSYEVMTPSAARGVLEAVLWKPAIVWNVHAIAVLAPVAWTSFRRNEVNGVASPREYYAADDRAQRNTVALRNVDYLVTASFSMTPRAGADDNVKKFEEMFERRLSKGQHFHQPYLGCREFFAIVEPADNIPAPPDQSDRPLGWMFYDFHHAKEGVKPLFFNARLSGGVMTVPDFETVLREQAAT